MVSEKNPAGEDGACEGFSLGGENKQGTATQPHQQDNLVGTITKNKREAIRVGLRTFSNGYRACDLRVYKSCNGVEGGTGQGFPLPPGDIDQLIELLHLVKAAAMAEGLI